MNNLEYSTNSKSKGVYYPFINKLVAALEERENVIKNYETIRDEARINMRKLRGKGNEEESEDEF
jgi:ribosome recycling factor